MKPFENIKAVYFIGIGGIGMSALARFFRLLGKAVGGYDRIPSPITDDLALIGIKIHFEDNVNKIPSTFISTSKNEIAVIYTPAVPDSHSEYNYFKNQDYILLKRAEALGFISSEYKTVAVAGTHGKTTVSTMTAHILNHSGIGVNAFLGGISKNFNSNLVVNKSAELCVAEADEFDRSFLKLFPETAVVTSADADHLDIYSDLEDVKNSFSKFISQIKPEGNLIIKKEVEINETNFPTNTYRYSVKSETDFYAENIETDSLKSQFDFVYPNGKISKIRLGVSGRVNIENAVAAAAVGILYGAEPEKIKEALETYSGVRRRFDYIFKSENVVYIDDYAHHPEELRAFIGSVREMYVGKKILGIFQPHLYSRTRDFAKQFAESLDLLDSLLLLEIYPAREEPIPGITSEIIINQCQIKEKQLCKSQNIPELIKNSKFDIILTMGAGDIENFREPIKEILVIKSEMRDKRKINK
jgi:UDP-N-acetylmuramate--alanine ligase